MINFVLKTRHFVLKTRHFVSQTRNCVFKMLNFAENAKRDMANSLTAAEGKRGGFGGRGSISCGSVSCGSISCGSISCDEVKARLRRSRDQRDGVARDQCCKLQYICHLFSELSIENVERM